MDYDQTRDAAIERAETEKFEKYFRSHPELRNGRNFRHWNHQYNKSEDRAYRENFVNIFPNSPGAEY